MILLYILLGLAVVCVLIVVGLVFYLEKKQQSTKWEEHRWLTEAEEEAKELEDLDILFEDIWDDVEK